MEMAVEPPQRRCTGLGGEGPDDRRAEARLVGHNGQTSAVSAGVRRRRNRSCVGTVDSEERGPTAGVAESGLSGAAGRLAAPLRDMHSRREDGRLDHLSRCCAASRRGDIRTARMAASGLSLDPSAYRRHCQRSDGAVGSEQWGIAGLKCRVATANTVQE